MPKSHKTQNFNTQIVFGQISTELRLTNTQWWDKTRWDMKMRDRAKARHRNVETKPKPKCKNTCLKAFRDKTWDSGLHRHFFICALQVSKARAMKVLSSSCYNDSCNFYYSG